ncbi:glucose 1-dehydrogenase [Sphingobium sp. AN558]|uniref:glucose 1-dehydrogenase n=1 Tax=Sphingobium sp. AN558 TaxID=3133442 RepID=UPI0030C53FA8
MELWRMKRGRLENKVAIVTGGAGGIGTAVARAFSREGAKVMLADVADQAGQEVARSCGPDTRYSHLNVADENEWLEVVAETERHFGPVGILVNNAGIVRHGPLEIHREDDFRQVIEVNQIGVFLGMKSVVASMKRAGSGSIINLSSVAGLIGAANAIGYTASKFAVRGMTKVAAIELAPANIRVNSVHPGVTRTPLTDLSPEDRPVLERMLAETPAGRWAEPEEIANIILMLASDESSFATGAEFVVDGGMTCR